MKIVLKVLGKTMKVIFIAFFIYLISLCFRQQRLPSALVAGICERLSTPDIIVTCDTLSFGFRHGIQALDLRVYDRRRRENLTPVFAADSISFQMVSRRLTVVAAKMPRLGDSYYGVGNHDSPDIPAGEASTDFLWLARLELPRIPDFTLELIRPDILGVAPEKAVTEVTTQLKRVTLDDIRIEWPDRDHRMELNGDCSVDFGALMLAGDLHGTAKPDHIRPLLKALDLPSSYPYMGGYPETGSSGFTEVADPVPVGCRFSYDFASRDFNIDLDLHPNLGRYNGVRLQRADGRLAVHSNDGRPVLEYDVEVGPLVATDPHGRRLQGWLTVHGTNGLDTLEFDAKSDLEMQNLLDIVGYLNNGAFDYIVCDTPPRVTAAGVFNCDDVNIPNNDCRGHFELDKGELFGMPVNDLKLDYRLKGSEISVDNLYAVGMSGGRASGWMEYHLPIADDDEAGLYGRGVINVRDARIVQVPLFLALTSALADNVPGIDRIVTQSESHCEYTVTNGVLRLDRFVVEGALFCFKLSGTCETATGQLDVVAHCTIMKEESILGKYLIQPVLWPFTKLFTEFHVSGTTEKPVIRNKSVKSFSDMTGDVINKVFK